MTGELAALGTSLCWAASALAGAAGAARVGTLAYNLARLALGFVLLAAVGVLLPGRPWLGDLPASGLGWLIVSGVVGFFLGDLALFRALALIGARRAMLVMCLWPLLAAALEWLWLGRALHAGELVGVVLTIGGIAWVVTQRRDGGAGAANTRGVLLAVLGAVGQAVGYVLAQPALALPSCHPVAATELRILAGLAGFVALALATGGWRALAGLRRPTTLGITAIGAGFGPCLGVTLSLVPLHLGVATGVAGALASLTPVLLLPWARWVQREPVGWRAVLGAVAAVSGVAVVLLL